MSQRLQVVTVGAAGGLFASSPETLKYTLSRLSEELGTTRIEFYPDAGAVTNNHVRRQYEATWKLAKRWGYDIQVAWWGQVAKGQPDIDELEDPSSIQFISTWDFLRRGNPLKALLDSLTRKSNRVKLPVVPREQAQAADVVEYKEGDRLKTWQQGVQDGYKFILDQSAPGTGKSHRAGMATPAFFGVERVIFATDEHRNPTTSTLLERNGWGHLEARHDGLTLEVGPDGSTRIRRAKGSAVPNIQGNCNRTRLAGVLRMKNVQGADSANVLCGGCPLREACTHGAGHNFGYLYQRHQVLSMPKFRAHPDSLPVPTHEDGYWQPEDSYAYDNTLIIWDEAGKNLTPHHEVKVNAQDVTQLMGYLAVKSPELLAKLQPLFTFLLQVFSGEADFKIGRFGLNHGEILPKLPDLSEVGWGVEAMIETGLEFLNTSQQYGVDLQDLSPSVRKKFADRDSEAAEKVEQNVPKRWLDMFLGVLGNWVRGSFHLTNWELTITNRSHRHSAIAKAAKANVFLDATLTREDLALKLGVSPDQILVVKQQDPDQSNLTITQVIDVGRMGQQRGNSQQDRAAVIVSHFKGIDPEGTMAIEFKALVEKSKADGAWWVDSRGTNCFTQIRRLIVIGTPCKNLASLLAEFSAVTGVNCLEDPTFVAYVNRSILAEFHQAIGRLRAHRRPGEKLEVILLTDFTLDIPTNQVKASDICLEAASKLERVELAIRGAVAQLQEAGQKITQAAIAAITGYSQGYISQFRELLQTLLDSFNSKSNNFSAPTPDLESLETATASAINEVVDNGEMTPEVIEETFFNWLTPGSWLRVFEKLTAQAQTQVIQTLIPCLPGEQLELIEDLIGGDPIEAPA